MDLKKRISDYLEKATLMQVATTINNQPWTCTVYFAFDDLLHLYWLSKPNARHSQELQTNNKVAGTIVLPHTYGDAVRGLQFQGNAHEITDKQSLERLLSSYAKRYSMTTERTHAIINSTDGHLLYRVRPSLFVLFDQVHFPDNPRQEYHL